MLWPINTSVFSNSLNADELSAQHKALIGPFQEKFNAIPEDTLYFIENFTQWKEAGVMAGINFIIREKSTT